LSGRIASNKNHTTVVLHTSSPYKPNLTAQ